VAKLSGNRWVATFHRVRSLKRGGAASKGRYLVPFFFEPGSNCVVKSVEGDETVYGDHVLEKMKGWVKFRDVVEELPDVANTESTGVKASSDDLSRYAARDAASPDAKNYRGGDTVVIGATAATAILAVLLLVILL